MVHPSKGIIEEKISVCEYLGPEQLIYVDCSLEQLLIVRLEPSISFNEGELVGLGLIYPTYIFDSWITGRLENLLLKK